jgi:hypothetical protein
MLGGKNLRFHDTKRARACRLLEDYGHVRINRTAGGQLDGYANARGDGENR